MKKLILFLFTVVFFMSMASASVTITSFNDSSTAKNYTFPYSEYWSGGREYLELPYPMTYLTQAYFNFTGRKIITDYCTENPDDANCYDNSNAAICYDTSTQPLFGIGLNKTFSEQRVDKIGFYFTTTGTGTSDLNATIRNSSLDVIDTASLGTVSASGYYEANFTLEPELTGTYIITADMVGTPACSTGNRVNILFTESFNPYNETRYTLNVTDFDNPIITDTDPTSLAMINITYVEPVYPTDWGIDVSSRNAYQYNGTLIGDFQTPYLGDAFNFTLQQAGNFLRFPIDFFSQSAGILEMTAMYFSNEGFTENNQTYNDIAYSLGSETFTLNITYDDVSYTSVTATLNYNNTVYSSTSVTNDNTKVFTSTVSVPQVTATTNKSFYWNVTMIDSNGTEYYQTSQVNQTVYPISIDDCSVNTELILNYTMFDEDDLTALSDTGDNTTVEVDMTITSIANPAATYSFSNTYNRTLPAQACVGSGTLGNASYRFDVQARYFANDYVVEFHNIQNATLDSDNFPQNIQLYPLLVTQAQEFLITYKDENFLPVEDALITITRKYVGEGLFRTVEAPVTNVDGQALVHLVLSDVIYTIQVTKDGRTLAIFDNIVPFCENLASGNCQISLNAFSTDIAPTDFTTLDGMDYLMSFDKSSRTITTTFNINGGATATVLLNATLFDHLGNTTVCSDSLTSSGGTLTCTIPASYGNATVYAYLYKDNNFINAEIYSLAVDAFDTFGYTGYLFALFLFMTLPLMFISSPVIIVIGAMLGIIFAVMLNLFTGGSIIGVGSTIIWFLIAGGILIWKINNIRR